MGEIKTTHTTKTSHSEEDRDLYDEQVRLAKHRNRSNQKDKMNQSLYSRKLEKLFDISHANAASIIRNEEDRQFLKLQQTSRAGSIGSVDTKLVACEKRSAQRRERKVAHHARCSTQLATITLGSGSSGIALVDRLPELLSSLADGNTKLLGVPKLASGKGVVAANAIHQQLISWQCEQLVIGMCFDTTASNTGRLNGACTLLEQCLGRNLLWMACRHHMLEVLLADAFGICLGPSTGPEILFFKRFRESWPKLNTLVVQLKPPKIPVTDTLKTFISDQLMKQHTREDYTKSSLFLLR